MAQGPVLELRLGDRIGLRRPHPCGGSVWSVVRVGADIGLVCDGCGRRVLLERRDLERRFTGFVDRGPAAVRDTPTAIVQPVRRSADGGTGT